jgi:nucleoside phosphorylase
LPEEFAAVRSFIDEPGRVNVDGDRGDYVSGTMPGAGCGPGHQLVLTLLGETGNDAAAGACTNLLRSFPSVRCLLMVGIAAGVPDPARPERHVRLGDIVVARWGIVEYDSVRVHDDGSVPRRTFPPPSPLLERRARLLQAGEMVGDRPWEKLLADQTQRFPEFGRPPETTDVVYSSVRPDLPVPHPDRALSGHRPGLPKVHSGLIASGDRSLRCASKRDQIAAEHGVLAIEMESKGIGNTCYFEGAEWFAVRGISDYGDGHVTTTWRRYASMAAAAYVRALLAATPPGPRSDRGG